MVLAVTGCAEAPSEPEAAVTAIDEQSVEQTVEQAPEPEIQEDTSPPEPTQVETLAIYDELFLQTVQDANPGSPMIVAVDSLDSRIADEYRAAGLTQAVALLPAAYVPFEENEDPEYYPLAANGATGSCATLQWLEHAKQTIYDGVDESRATMTYTCLDNVRVGDDEPSAGAVYP